MKLKYQDQINLFGSDLDEFKEQDRLSYRWVFEDIKDQRNFIPRYFDETVDRTIAEGWALSFFDTSEQAKTRLLKLVKDKEFLFKKLGTHIAKGELKTHDGISNNSNKFGHFDLFEYENVILDERFDIMEQVEN